MKNGINFENDSADMIWMLDFVHPTLLYIITVNVVCC